MTVPAQDNQKPSLANPMDAETKPQLRLKPVPDKETNDRDDASDKAKASDKTKEANTDRIPRLNDPSDRTASRIHNNVRRVGWTQAAPQKKLTRRQIEEGGWYSAK